MQSIVRIHRFNDRVAVYIGGETVYLNRDEARELAQALLDCQMDVFERRFSESSFPTFSLPVEGTKHD